MQNEIYKKIVKTKKHTVKTNLKTYIWHNKNKMLNYDYITGGKTGYTEKAKRTLVSTSSKNNINLIVVTIKDSDDWNTHKMLHEKILNNYINYKVLNKNDFKVPTDNYYKKKLYIKEDIYITLNKDETKSLISHIKLEQKDNYQDGDKVGTNAIYLDNTLLKEIDIYVKKEKNEKKKFVSKIRKWFND